MSEWQNMAGTNPVVAPRDCTNPAQSEPVDSPELDLGEMENPGARAGAAGAKVDATIIDPENDTSDGDCDATPSVPLPGVFNRSRFAWAEAIAASDVTPRAQVLAYVIIAQAADRFSGAVFWTRARFAEALNCSEDTVKRLFRALEEAGWLQRKIAQGRGTVVRIIFTIPADRLSTWGGKVHHPAPTEPALTAQGGRKGQYQSAPTGHGGAAEPPDTTRKGGDVTPFRRNVAPVQRVQDCPEKGAGLHPPYITPKEIPNTRPPERGAQARGGAPSIAQTEEPERPDLPTAAVAHFGSDREAEWNAWLTANRLPSVAELGVLSSDAKGRGFEVPFRRPPTPEHFIETRLALRWANWASQRKG